jgi:hypothetical protein
VLQNSVIDDPQHEGRRTSASRWPSAACELPLFLTPQELAELLKKSVRTLQRDRASGRSLPFTKHGRTVLYPRDPVLAMLSSQGRE